LYSDTNGESNLYGLYLFISFIRTKNCERQSPSCCVSSCFVHKQISIYNNSSLYAGLFSRVWYAEDNVRLTTAWVRTMCLTSLGWSFGRRSGKDVDTDCGDSWFISRICSQLQYLDWGLWILRLVSSASCIRHHKSWHDVSIPNGFLVKCARCMLV